MATGTKINTYTVNAIFSEGTGILNFFVEAKPQTPGSNYYLIKSVTGQIYGKEIASLIPTNDIFVFDSSNGFKITNRLNTASSRTGFIDNYYASKDAIGLIDLDGNKYMLASIITTDRTSLRLLTVKTDGKLVDDESNRATTAINSATEGSSGADKFSGTEKADLIYALAGNDAISGLGGDDTIFGGDGNDTLIGGEGNDKIDGGNGSSDYLKLYDQISAYTTTYDATTARLTLTHKGNPKYQDGTDTISNIEKFNFSDTSNSGKNAVLVNVYTMGNADNQIVGSSNQDWIYSGSGNDTIDGGAGADTMAGGAGNDTYSVDKTEDVVIEAKDAGMDIINSSASFTLAANIENLTLTGTASSYANGNDLDNVIIGNAGNNSIDGGMGNDTLAGGAGNDTYVVSNSGDIVKELEGAGIDTVNSGISYILGSNLENLTLTGSGDLNATGNDLNNIIVGNAGNNSINGGNGKDTLTGGSGNDRFVFSDASSSTPDNPDTITDFKSGTDKIQLSFNISSSNNVALVPSFTGVPGQITFGANKLSIDINGDKTADFQVILTGVSTITAADITAPASNQGTSNGGSVGAATLMGGPGDNTFTVTNTADVIIESVNAGIDTVQSSVSYTLGENIENLTLTGTASITATGNVLSNNIIGNRADNTIDGGAGADTMLGGAGNDIYYVDAYQYDTHYPSDSNQSPTGDVVREDESRGTDTIYYSAKATFYELPANVENFIMKGTGKISLTANALNNAIAGGAGNDTILGGIGRDTLSGGLGNDRFSYTDVSESTPNLQDTITDFQPGSDKILLLFSKSPLSSVNLVSAFSGIAGEMVFSNSMLALDIDGNKTEDFKITLSGVSQIQASDIQLTPLG